LLGKNSWIHHNFQVFAHLKSLGRWSIYAPKYSKYFWTWVNILTRIMGFAVYSFTNQFDFWSMERLCLYIKYIYIYEYVCIYIFLHLQCICIYILYIYLATRWKITYH
jgi:hypothetical protein